LGVSLKRDTFFCGIIRRPSAVPQGMEMSSVSTVESFPLKMRLRRAERRLKIKAVGLIAPLFLFLLITFLIPIVVLLHRVVENPEIFEVLPRTSDAIQRWDGRDIPDESVFANLAADLAQAKKYRTVAKVGKRLNYEITGYRLLIFETARKVSSLKTKPSSYRQALIGMDKRWAEVRYWAALKRASRPYTDFYLLSALDLERRADGKIVRVSKERALYLGVLFRTFWISFVVTAWCLILGYPVAYFLSVLPRRISNLLMIMVLLPFWTSLLVRTASWIIILQREGIINDGLVWLNLVDEPLQLVYNRYGVYVAMVHILLPFMILPLYSVMRNISPSYMRAATSLGASPLVAFWKVYIPQSLPGISAGCLLIYILAIGYYITPALVGGPGDQMLSYFVAFFINKTMNWGMASALAVLLLAATMLLYLVFNRLLGIERLRMG
jgi:putative spermidine/putrescine transport system permease protein